MRRNRKLALAIAATATVTLAVAQAATAVAAPSSASAATTTTFQPLSSAEAAALSTDANTPVIVVLRDQPAPAAPNTGAATARANGIAGAQAPLVAELAQVHGQHVKPFSLVNAVSATVSKAEADRLAANPDVAAVIPDSVVKGGPSPIDQAKAAAATAAPAADLPGSCAAPGKVQLEPEALDVTHTNSDDPTAKTARGLGFTGAGVRVGWIADGIDVNNPDFVRADGSHVIADFRDFTGDGPNAPNAAGESFIDASAIAAQGRQTYDISHFGAQPQSGPCNVRIEGVAPGASLYGFKVFGETNTSTTSAILQSIQWAVTVDHVNVINESFGFNPFPDNGAEDAIRLFNDAAVAAGVTVTQSSGDAGPNSTQGSGSTDPQVIATGASTTFRWLAQTGYAGTKRFATTGWLNDNISQLSSSGFNQAGRTIDLLAPGDESFALCTANADLYEDCTDFNGNPSNVERSGGTSESAPLTAGAAALVIQAYRQSHHGASPSPALVKQILTSTADDLTIPGDEQGAGRLNTYKAVLAAESVRDAHGSPAAKGATLLVDQSQLDATGTPGSTQHFRLSVTNTGATRQTVQLNGRAFGAPKGKFTSSVTLNDTTSPHFADWSGVNNNFGTISFTVPPRTDRLNADIAYPADPKGPLNARVRVILIDPTGKLAAHSLPQGVGNAGHVDVRLPAAGTWTAVIFGRDGASGGTQGKVQFSESIQNTIGFGTVHPSTLTLLPGQTASADVTANAPLRPGDASGAVVLNAGAGGQTSVPVILRSLVDTHTGKATFQGTLTGGVGRQSDLGQVNYYQFDAQPGQRDLSASVDLTNDVGDNVYAVLVDPQGHATATGTNELASSYNPTTRAGDGLKPILQTDVYVRDPQPGRWTLIVSFPGAIVGDELSQPFTVHLGFDTVDVHAHLPLNATLPAGGSVTVPVTVHNTGTAPQNFFVDPRLNVVDTVNLAGQTQTTGVPLPLPATQPSPIWLVPSETSGISVIGHATQPIGFDFGSLHGDPDVPSAVNGKDAVGAYAANPVKPGLWAAVPAELGPTPAGGGPAGTVDFVTSVSTKKFDAAITSPATDFWQASVAPVGPLQLITVQPGKTATIPVTIRPNAPKGTVVSGTLYVDQLVVGNTPQLTDLDFNDPGATEPSANELVGLPYQYTVG